MSTKDKYLSLTRFEVNLERGVFLIAGVIVGLTTLSLLPEKSHQEQLYRIDHMVKACIPNSPEQVTHMRLVKRNGQAELVCEKLPVSSHYSFKPAAPRREI